MQKTEITNPFTWDKRDIEIVKERVKTLPPLALLTPDDEFVVQTDASEHKWGAVYLTINKLEKDRKRRRICCYKSGTFSGASQTYHIHEKQLLAVIKAFEKYEIFLRPNVFIYS